MPALPALVGIGVGNAKEYSSCMSNYHKKLATNSGQVKSPGRIGFPVPGCCLGHNCLFFLDTQVYILAQGSNSKQNLTRVAEFAENIAYDSSDHIRLGDVHQRDDSHSGLQTVRMYTEAEVHHAEKYS